MATRRRPSGRRPPSAPRPPTAEVITTIALDAETHRRLRHLAVEERTSFRELIRRAIADYLAQHRGGN